MSKQKVYPKGLFINQPHANAPDFVVGKISVKVQDFVEFLNANKNEAGYVNLDLLNGNDGLYSVLDEWKPSSEAKSPKVAKENFKPVSSEGDLPF